MNLEIKSFEEFKEELATTSCGGIVVVYNSDTEKICSVPILAAEILVSIPLKGLNLTTLNNFKILQGTKNQNYINKDKILEIINEYLLPNNLIVKDENKVTISKKLKNYQYEKLGMVGL